MKAVLRMNSQLTMSAWDTAGAGSGTQVMDRSLVFGPYEEPLLEELMLPRALEQDKRSRGGGRPSADW